MKGKKVNFVVCEPLKTGFHLLPELFWVSERRNFCLQNVGFSGVSFKSDAVVCFRPAAHVHGSCLEVVDPSRHCTVNDGLQCFNISVSHAAAGNDGDAVAGLWRGGREVGGASENRAPSLLTLPKRRVGTVASTAQVSSAAVVVELVVETARRRVPRRRSRELHPRMALAAGSMHRFAVSPGLSLGGRRRRRW